jgi:chaperone required for assembly of F1-ATPase
MHRTWQNFWSDLMRDILGDAEKAALLSDPNPMKRAQKAMQTPLPKRFYKDVSVAEEQGGLFHVLLDGKPVKTPARASLSFATRAAAELVAAEFAAQEKEINPAKMPATRLANTAIDGVATEIGAVREDMLRFAANDLLCYRAEGPDALVARQADVWDRYIDWVRARYGARLYLTEGVMHIRQPREAIALIGAAINQIDDPMTLAVLHTMTTLTGSAVLALAVAEGEASAEEVWKAAHLDEDWTNDNWGTDSEAEVRRATRWLDMKAADMMLKALVPED